MAATNTVSSRRWPASTVSDSHDAVLPHRKVEISDLTEAEFQEIKAHYTKKRVWRGGLNLFKLVVEKGLVNNRDRTIEDFFTLILCRILAMKKYQRAAIEYIFLQYGQGVNLFRKTYRYYPKVLHKELVVKENEELMNTLIALYENADKTRSGNTDFSLFGLDKMGLEEVVRLYLVFLNVFKTGKCYKLRNSLQKDFEDKASEWESQVFSKLSQASCFPKKNTEESVGAALCFHGCVMWISASLQSDRDHEQYRQRREELAERLFKLKEIKNNCLLMNPQTLKYNIKQPLLITLIRTIPIIGKIIDRDALIPYLQEILQDVLSGFENFEISKKDYLLFQGGVLKHLANVTKNGIEYWMSKSHFADFKISWLNKIFNLHGYSVRKLRKLKQNEWVVYAQYHRLLYERLLEPFGDLVVRWHEVIHKRFEIEIIKQFGLQTLDQTQPSLQECSIILPSTAARVGGGSNLLDKTILDETIIELNRLIDICRETDDRQDQQGIFTLEKCKWYYLFGDKTQAIQILSETSFECSHVLCVVNFCHKMHAYDLALKELDSIISKKQQQGEEADADPRLEELLLKKAQTLYSKCKNLTYKEEPHQSKILNLKEALIIVLRYIKSESDLKEYSGFLMHICEELQKLGAPYTEFRRVWSPVLQDNLSASWPALITYFYEIHKNNGWPDKSKKTSREIFESNQLCGRR